MKTWQAFGLLGVALVAGASLGAQPTEVALTRPGQIIVTALTGDVTLTAAGQSRPAKVDDRVRVDTRVTAGRKSLATLQFSNGAVLELDTDSELEIEELLQAPFASYVKVETLKAEPSVSRTRLRLIRGDVRLVVKPLKVAGGSVFVVAMPAGEVRVGEGSLQAAVRMAEAGLGMCVLELVQGAAEFEVAGGGAAPVPVGRRLEFAVEIDRRTGAVKVGEMPKAGPGTPR